MNTYPQPKWLRDIRQLLPIRAQFVLSGNIRDLVLLGDGRAPVELKTALWHTLKELGYRGMIVWNPVTGLCAWPDDEDTRQALADATGLTLNTTTLPMNAPALGVLLPHIHAPSSGIRIALVVDYASRLTGNEADVLFLAAEKAAIDATARGTPRLYNPVFWLANRAADIPYWFTVENERVRALPVPMPDADTRARFAHALFRQIGEKDVTEDAFATALSGMTHNMSLNAMADIVSLAASYGSKASDIDDAVQSYRIGDMASVSPWRGNTLRESIIAAETSGSETAIENSVKGQPRAIARVLDALKRTSVGLTGAHASSGASRPRGVLFFVGPTGVGKTELAKTIARVVFGDASAYKRFDMSEFSAEHSGDRLIGAPPGYVGFDQGGELTNHMRERPFSVLLFDEVEKAHDRILDKFLQILEDGRLTDGRGETVHFSDALIIFTSNLGVSRTLPDGTVEHRIRYDEPVSPEEYESRIMEGVSDHFVRKLGRPELLNRLGENVVIFDFISEPVACAILDSMNSNVIQRVQEEHGVKLDITPIQKALIRHCTTDRSNGGRGIGSKLEEALINPLSRLLFTQMPRAGQTLVIDTFQELDGIHSLHGHTEN